MKLKHIISNILIILLIAGTYYYFKVLPKNKLSIHERLLNNDYVEVEESNYIKNINATDYYYFNLTKDNNYFILSFNNSYRIYFYENETSIIGECEYDIKNDKVINNTNCTTDLIDASKQLKKTFEEQIKEINVTISELEQYLKN